MGDTATRSLLIRLTTTRPDPENRSVKHSDPIEWTHDHRGQILRALYTVMLGNPRLGDQNPAEPQTRFKLWWHLIGSAIENGAICHRNRFAEHNPKCPPAAISFRDEFLANEAQDDEQGHALSIALGLLRSHGFTGTFTATHLLHYARTVGDVRAADFRAEFFDAIEAANPGMKPPTNGEYSSRSLTWRLDALVDATASVEGKVFCLRKKVPDDDPKAARLFSVEEVPPEDDPA